MIIKEIMYGVQCDRCGDIHESYGYTLFSCEDEALEESEEDSWIEDGGMHYCTGCYDMDEESGECKPKPEYTEHVKKFKKVLEVLLNGGVTLNEYSDSFELSGNTYRGFSSAKVDAVKLLLGDSIIEFNSTPSKSGSSTYVKVKIKK